MKRVTAFAPATVANVAVGFDLLGYAFGVIGDEVTLSKTSEREVRIKDISWSSQSQKKQPTDIPKDPHLNTATAGLVKLLADVNLGHGFEVAIKKGIPLGSGMGGSAASAVAAIVAANRFLSAPLSKTQMLSYALVGESQASGAAHADNISPCLWGGLTFTRSIDPIDVIAIPVPNELWTVLVHPELRLDTKTARAALKANVPLKDHIKQSANLGAFLAACFQNDLSRIQAALCDCLIEPQRAHLIPHFSAVKNAGLAAGALGCSISGAGPSLFAWADSKAKASTIATAMVSSFAAGGVKAEAWVAPISKEGAHCTMCE